MPNRKKSINKMIEKKRVDCLFENVLTIDSFGVLSPDDLETHSLFVKLKGKSVSKI